MLTQAQARQLTEKVLKLSKFPDCTATINEEEVAYVRFANNGVTTSGFTVERSLSVTSVRDAKAGVSRTTDLSEDGLRAVIRRSEEVASFAPANPEYMEPLAPQNYSEHDHWDESTAQARSPQMIGQIKSIIDGAVTKKLVAAGYFERSAVAEGFGDKSGNFGFQRSTDARLTTTIRDANGTSSGWAGQPSVRIGEINGAELGARAIAKCAQWKNPVRLDPGKYTVVLEPTAVGDLLSQLAIHLSARSADQGQSFLSRRGGGTLVGEKLFPDLITLRTDPSDKRIPTSRWSQGGLPSRPVTWIDKGVVQNVVYDRYWASKTNKSPTPAADDLILDGSTLRLQDLIQATKRGLLVTRFWYIRSVNPQTVQLTGLTRDGLFLIENGKIAQPVMNLRFTESVVRLLQNTTMISRNERVRGGEAGMVGPAIQARDFTFTSVSDAV